MSRKGVQQIIESVQDAVAKECWLPALTTALIIPDIMGQIEFPDLVNKLNKHGRRSVGKQYKFWFTKHVVHHFANEEGWDAEGNPINPYFTADMCYRLRCSILHQGNDNIEHEYNFENEEGAEYNYEFELRVNACNSYGVMWVDRYSEGKEIRTIRVCVDIKTLCKAICEEALSFLKASSNDFDDVGVELVDVSRKMNAIRTQ